MLEKIKFSLDLGGVVGAVFLHLRKAFDTVEHKVLLTKISKFNFCNGAMKWVELYLTNRSQSVPINNHRSKSLQLPTGVPQGSILGPLLFSIYINDLPSVCPEVETIMYADDTVFFGHGRSKADFVHKLTRSMAQITTWLRECCLQSNFSKTVSMFFCKTNKTTSDHQRKITGCE